MKEIILLILSFFACFVAFSQEIEIPEMDTDRPSRSDASSTVPKGYFQLETGFFFQQDETALEVQNELKLPDLVARIGLTDRLELRFRAQEHILAVTSKVKCASCIDSEGPKHGIDGLEIGGKYQLWKEKNLITEAALQAEVKLPLGSDAFDTGSPEPKLRLALSKEFNPQLMLHANIGLEWEVNREAELKRAYNHNSNYALNLSYDFTEKLETFVELYGEKREEQKFQYGFDTGFGYKFLPNLEIDLSVGIGLSDNAPDYFVETGISFRLPK